MTITKIDECLDEVGEKIKKFLKENGGESFGYCTSVSGAFYRDKEFCGGVHWDTPVAAEELTEKGKESRAKKLYEDVSKVLEKYEIDSVIVKNEDAGYGYSSSYVSYFVEAKKKIDLY